MTPTDAANRLIQSALLGEAIDRAAVGVFVADETRRYVAVSDYAARRLGYERAELLGLRVDDVATYADAPGEYDELLRDGTRKGVAQLTCKDGTTVHFDYVAATTEVAHMQVYVSVGFFLEPDEATPRGR